MLKKSSRRHRMTEAEEDEEIAENIEEIDTITRFDKSPWCKLLSIERSSDILI